MKKVTIFILSCLVLLAFFTYFNWNTENQCNQLAKVSYNDLQECLKVTKMYVDYQAIPEPAKTGKGQRVIFQSIGKECRLYVNVDAIVADEAYKWSDYCIVKDPIAFSNCVESSQDAKCSQFFTR